MKKFIEFLNHKNLHFKELKSLNPKDFDSRKKLLIYEGIDLKLNYCIIFVYEMKSRFVVKNALELVELVHTISKVKEHNYRYKSLIVSSAICSKAKDFLKTQNWIIHNDFM
ncbi:hypothetical protein [Arcobacter sp. FWKO B]|uniref:hypothetical protein n=1 Tax=Arcobacter sp. FWKO B TaxID=2593672 RepID=UPI0018A495ED|nr:hypothetical protein [Arcobacter sp. FWKO B]QOG12902.1 hypothetical protein FWKOB_09440 [Arcobacter sp. FWKO B]